jgi:chorismate mutase / prephenate dehydratase
MHLNGNCAFLGPIGTYSYQASLLLFPPTKTVPKDAIKQILSSSEAYLLVPLENSTFGAVAQTLDNLNLTSFDIFSSIILPINHCLLALDASTAIKTIYSHPEALGQCEEFLARYYENVEIVAVQSTAHGALLASKDNGIHDY